MYTIYAFCREIDSAVDDALPGTDVRADLEKWRKEVSAVYRGTPTSPVAISLASHVHRLDIPEEYLQEVISGVEMDLTANRYPTFQALYPYCYRVASVVGLICLKIFGTQSPSSQDYAINLGMAFQLTNIIRDIKSDADRNRIYLPLEDLAQFGYTEKELLERRYSPTFFELMKFECDRARQFYLKAKGVFETLPRKDRRSLVVAEIMHGVYARILEQIEANHYQVFGPRIRLSPLLRLGIAANIWWRSSSRGIQVPQS